MNENTKLNHENLDVYNCAIEFLSITSQISKKLPRGQSEIKDQIKRASLSIVLNIAEGYGKFSSKDKKRFYLIAKGSSHESGALLDSMRVLELISDNEYYKGKRVLYRIVSMLVRMCQ